MEMQPRIMHPIARHITTGPGTRAEDECSEGCSPHWIDDCWCDFLCNVAACNFDKGNSGSEREWPPSNYTHCMSDCPASFWWNPALSGKETDSGCSFFEEYSPVMTGDRGFTDCPQFNDLVLLNQAIVRHECTADGVLSQGSTPLTLVSHDDNTCAYGGKKTNTARRLCMALDEKVSSAAQRAECADAAPEDDGSEWSFYAANRKVLTHSRAALQASAMCPVLVTSPTSRQRHRSRRDFDNIHYDYDARLHPLSKCCNGKAHTLGCPHKPPVVPSRAQPPATLPHTNRATADSLLRLLQRQPHLSPRQVQC